ncbi:hypothetical protein JKP88DRAFT_279225 [Tribonema minus]|uniref:Uncharacterized protein n=1 Tax=Tribonema minus TaxID=303371 RepID=A0A835YTF8_9STRA|nr:hypothetical protein JKP88DRAFT_279225 [Tribonema minus]
MSKVLGGEGVAFHDVYEAAAPRARAGVTVNVDANNQISYLAAGEWYEYTVRSRGGPFAVTYNMASGPPYPMPFQAFLTLDNSCTASQQALYSDDTFTTNGLVQTFFGGALTLPAGDVPVRICFKAVKYGRFAGITLSPTQGPYNGVYQPIPGTVVATSFDLGGAGLAYKVLSAAGQPLVRAGETVTGSAQSLGYLTAGEWFKYSVNVLSSATYNVAWMLAGDPTAPVPLSLYLVLDGNCSGTRTSAYKTSTFDTNSWNTATAFRVGTVNLTAGKHIVTVCVETASYVNIMGIRFSTLLPPTVPPPTVAPADPGTPYQGKRQPVPGTIQPSLFDTGGQGVAYNDVSPTGTPLLRIGDKVGGADGAVGYVADGEWIRYSVTVASSANYGIKYMLSGAPSPGVTLNIYLVLDTNDCGASAKAPLNIIAFGTGSWTTPVAYPAGDTYLPGGAHTLTLCFKQASNLSFSGISVGASGSANGVVPAYVSPAGAAVTTPAYKNWPLRWSDEFNGGNLDLNKWQYSIGNACNLGYCGWGNNEQQSYQSSAVYMSNGNAVLEARKEWSSDGSPYISGKIVSRAENNFNVLYGRVESRINFPVGQGFWPSLWMLPDRYMAPGPYGTWPASGEIDIVEVINDIRAAHHSLHYGATGKHDFQTCSFYNNGGTWGNGYHTYAVEWAPWGEFKYYVDGQLGCTINHWWSSGGAYPTPFVKPFYVILNFAVGGSWPGTVDNNLFSNGQRHQALYDYVRVYNWPGGRRLQDDGTFIHDVPEGWEVPEGFDLDTLSWDPAFASHVHQPSDGASPDEVPQVPATVPDGPEEVPGDTAPPTVAALPTVPPTKTACNAQPYMHDRRGTPLPWVLPTDGELTIGAEFFDLGGQACAFNDHEPYVNRGNNDLRGARGVDLVSYDGATNGPYVFAMQPGDWLSYTVSAQSDDLFSVQVFATAPAGNGVFRIVIDSTNCDAPESDGGSVLVADRAVQATSGPTDWRFYGTNAAVAAGVHRLTLCAVAGSLNVDYLRFELQYTPPATDPFDAPLTSAIYGGPAVVGCVSHSCHDAGLDVALTAHARADEGANF